MEYNVKKITYPDLSCQYRLYSTLITGASKEDPVDTFRPIEFEPFEGMPVRSLDDAERSQEVSRKRTLDKIYSYARSNEWEYFVTFTFSKDKVNRYDFSEIGKVMSKWLNNVRRYAPGLSYLMVPELHKDGAYHFHALMSHCDGLNVRDSGKCVVKRFKGLNGRMRFIRTQEKIYLFGRWKYGWMTATKVKDNERVTKYITKYVTKDLCTSTFGKKRYWVSRNLEVPEVETFCLDAEERFILASELGEVAGYHKSITCVGYKQQVNVFELG